MTRKPVCSDTYGGHRKCIRDAGHAGVHSDGERFWQFVPDTTPEWLRRMRVQGLPAKEMPL